MVLYFYLRGHETGHNFLKTISFSHEEIQHFNIDHLHRTLLFTLSFFTVLLTPSAPIPFPRGSYKNGGTWAVSSRGAGCLRQPIHRCLWLIGPLIACNGSLFLIKKKKKNCVTLPLIIKVFGGKVVRNPANNWDRVRASVRARDAQTHTHTWGATLIHEACVLCCCDISYLVS